MFARPGPRLVDALEFLVGLLHNKHDVIPRDFPWTWWDSQKASSAVNSMQTRSKAIQSSTAPAVDVDSTSHTSRHVDDSSKSRACDGHAADRDGSSVCNGTSDKGLAPITCDSMPAQYGSADHSTALNSDTSSHGCDTATADGNPAYAPAKTYDGAVQQNSVTHTEQQDTRAAAQQESQHAIQRDTQQMSQQISKQDSKQNSKQAAQPAAKQAERKWGAAPFLGTEIEEAHAAAIDAGQPTYTDPATSYKVALGCCIHQLAVHM